MASAVGGGGSSDKKSSGPTTLDLFQAASHGGDPSVLGPLAEELELTHPPLAPAVVARAQTAQILCAIITDNLPEVRFTHDRATAGTRERAEFASAYDAARALRRSDTAACLAVLTAQAWPEQLYALGRSAIGAVRARATAFIARSFETVELEEALRILALNEAQFQEMCAGPFGWKLEKEGGKSWVRLPALSARQAQASGPVVAGSGAALKAPSEIARLADGVLALERTRILKAAEAQGETPAAAGGGGAAAGGGK